MRLYLSGSQWWGVPGRAIALGFAGSLTVGLPAYAGKLPTPALPPATVDFTQPLTVSHVQIDLSDRRLTLYHNSQPLREYPIAVGREGWTTPVGEFQVMQMVQNPTWQNPLTGNIIEAGDPSNPLGHHWIGFWTDGNNWVGMHGTPDADSVGQAVSHGCVRLYAHHIQEVFGLVQVGTRVVVVP